MDVKNGNDPAAGVSLNDNDKWFPEVDIRYFSSNNVAAERVLTIPQKHDVTAVGLGKIGTVKHLPPTFMLQDQFLPGADVDRNSFSAALQIGRISRSQINGVSTST